MKKRNSGFTLVELLVVLSIIGILAALLFPAFKRAQESSSQAACASNLKQIGVAVRQYFLDERMYPPSLAALMPASAEVASGQLNINATGRLASVEIGLCPNDDTEVAGGIARMSYGYWGTGTPTALAPSTAPTDGGAYVWNYFGYNAEGYAYQTSQEAADATWPSGGAAVDASGLLYPTREYKFRDAVGYATLTGPVNPVKNSLSNRYAEGNAIITHCIYHRVQTAYGLNTPVELYHSTDPNSGTAAKDIVLLLSGDVKTKEVSTYKDGTPPQWQKQNF